MDAYGKIILKSFEGDEKSYTLAKPVVVIGRGAENDIVLLDPRV